MAHDEGEVYTTFTEWLEAHDLGHILDEFGNVIDGTNNGLFASNYTNWIQHILDVFTNTISEEVDGLEDSVSFVLIDLNFHNDEGPIIAWVDADDNETLLTQGQISEIFGGPESFSWFAGRNNNVEHVRHYMTSFLLGGEEPENLAPTDIRINIDPDFAAAVGGATTGNPNSEGNNTSGVAGEDGMLIGILFASDPNEGDTHVFQIVDEDGNELDHDLFEIVNGNELILKQGESITSGDGIFTLTIKVTDDGDPPLSYYETFTFNVGTNAGDELEGTNTGGEGTLTDPVVGDDLIFGFGNGDTLNDDGVALTGTSGDDALFGGQGNDTLYGGEGDDQLFGGFGNDDLYGGPGADIMSGGEGNDTFFWLAGDMAGTTNDHFDAITDWGDAGDSLDISGLLASFAGFDPDDANFDLANWVNVSEVGGDTIVAVDPTGSGGATDGWSNLVTLLGVTGEDLNSLNIVHE